MADVSVRSPFADVRHLEGGGPAPWRGVVTVEDASHRPTWQVHGATARRLTQSRPYRAGVVSRRGELLLWSFAPSRWRVAWADATPDARVDITGALGVDALPADVTDLAHATATVRMTGAGVPAVLARVCPVDLRRFADGHAVRTSMAQVPTEVLRVDRDGPTYLLSVSRSFGPYFWALLTQAAGELSGDEDEYKRTLRPASQVGIIMTDNVDQARVGG